MAENIELRDITMDATMRLVAIKTATPANEQRVFATLLLAFFADPAVRWLYSDPHDYLTHWPAFMRAFGGRALEQGTAYHTDDHAGAALWLPPGVEPDEETIVALLEQSVAPDRQPEIFSVFEQMGTFHPSEPHWYLPLIGVDPTRQNRGIGTALLQPALAQCDRDQLPAYLESSNPRNISLYERHGFEVVGTIRAGSAPPLYPMVRQPRPVK